MHLGPIKATLREKVGEGKCEKKNKMAINMQKVPSKQYLQ